MRSLGIPACVLGIALVATGARGVAAPDDPARAVATATADQLERYYVYPTLAHAAGELLRRNAAAGAYDGLHDRTLAQKLTADLAVVHDKHVRVGYSAEVNPPAKASGEGQSPEEKAAEERWSRSVGYGLGHVVHLPGNVGYIELHYFLGSAREMSTVFDGLANAVAYSDAVVIDLRRNHGGDPKVVARFLSHFLVPKTHLNDFVGRGDGETKVRESTYTENVPGPRITVPMYVLISGETFSGGEECAYDVQSLKRGTLIGAVTGGGANPGESRRVGDHFSVFVPEERAQNPITKTNWEGVGVKPDVTVARERALTTAYAAALDAKLRDASLEQDERATLTALRGRVDTMSDAEILAL